MKKYIIIFTLLLISTLANAKPKFGILAEINSSKINNSIPIWEDITLNHIGFAFGVISKFSLSQKFDFLPSLEYSQRGTDYSNSQINLPTTKNSLHYLNLSPIFSFKAHKIINIDAGPQISYLLSAHEGPNGIEDVTFAYKRFDFSIIGGVSININESISISIKYTYGLLDINNNLKFSDPGSPEEYSIPTQYSRSFSIGVIYFFKSKLQ